MRRLVGKVRRREGVGATAVSLSIPTPGSYSFLIHTASALRARLVRLFPFLGSTELMCRLGVTLAVLTAIRFGQTAPLPAFHAAAVAAAGSGGSAAAAAAIAAATGGGTMEAALEGVAGGLAARGEATAAALLELGTEAGDPPTAAAALFSLGIGPAISAGWLFSAIQLMYVPGWPDPFGGLRRWINALRSGSRDDAAEFHLAQNWAASFFAAIAGWRTAAALAPFVRRPLPPRFLSHTTAMLATGALVVRWLTNAVDAYGLGDGVSLLIAISVVSGYARSLRAFASALLSSGRAPGVTAAAGAAVAACSLAIVAAAVWLTQVEARLPLVVYRRRRRVSGVKGDGAAGASSPWAAYAAWGAASEAAAAAGKPPPAFEKALAAGGGDGSAAAPGNAAPPAPGAASVVLGAPVASYLPLRLTPGAMGPLLMGSLALHLVPSALGLLWPAGGAALAGWLGRPLVGPLATAFLIVASEAISTASREDPRSLAEWMAASEMGIRGVPPGAATEAVLVAKGRATRLAGAGTLALLSLAAAGMDGICRALLNGAAPGSSALLLCVGFVASTERQVKALVATPKLERSLRAERRAVREQFRLERGEAREVMQE